MPLCFSISSSEIKIMWFLTYSFEILLINMCKGFQDLHTEKQNIFTVTVKTPSCTFPPAYVKYSCSFLGKKKSY